LPRGSSTGRWAWPTAPARPLRRPDRPLMRLVGVVIVLLSLRELVQVLLG
jgi:hypothetical protein